MAALFADRTLAQGRDSAGQLRRAGFATRCAAAVAAGVDLTGIRASFKRSVRLHLEVVSVGRIAASEGALDLTYAWQFFVARNPDANRAVIGDGPDGVEMEDRVQRYVLDDRVDFLGPILETSKQLRWISALRRFALPSHEESRSIAIGEAVTLGAPVVAYDLPELPEFWGDAFHALSKGDIPGFANAVSCVLADDAGRRELVECGLAWVSELDRSVIAERELQLHMGDLAGEDPRGVDPWLVASSTSRAPSDRPHPRPADFAAS